MNANSALDDSRRSSAESQSSNGTATSDRSNRSGATASTTSSSTQQQKRKMRPSTAPVKNVKAVHSTSSHRASTAPSSNSNTINNTTTDDAASNVRVVARLRPLSTKERNEHSTESIRANVHSSSIAVPDHHNDTGNNNNTRKFEFDAVFPPNSSQEQVYQTTCGDMISKSIFRGFNATILAYGQTGSGKTYTMGTDYSSSDSGKPIAAASSNNNSSSSSLAPPAKSEGVIGRAVHDLFSTRNSLPNGRNRVKVEMSYLEIYNEQAIDLLSDDHPTDASASTLQVRDSKSEGVVVQNLNSFIVSSPGEVAALMEKAGAKRATGSTQMNSVSSRSHAICTLTVTIAPLESSDGGSGSNNEEASSSPRDHAMRAKLTLVDLAGSERIKRTGAEGARMKEGININKGLFVLGQVVSALSELGQSGKTSRSASSGNNTSHIPYRDSKLTRLLQDSLGGNSRTVMIACISPADSNVEESTNTLRYAERTRNIKNSAVRNVVSTGLSASEAAALRRENQQLKLELAQMETKMHMSQGGGSYLGHGGSGIISSLENSQDIALVAKLQAQCTSFLAEIAILKEKGQNHANEVLEASERADKWQMKAESILQTASEQGIVLPDSMKENNLDLVSQLRSELNDCKAELSEARTDAAVARATAGVIISGKGGYGDMQDMKSSVEDMIIDEDGEEDDDEDDGKEQLTTELSAVSNLIEQKEAMVVQITKERACRDNLQHHLENSLKLLQTEVESLTSERDGLLTKMSSTTEHRRKGKPDDPTTKKLRNELTRLGDRIKELNQKANEHKRSIRMREEAERRCEKLMAEIAEDKKRRASLQKKLKETSIEMRAEKKAAHQKALKMMKDTQKLKIEMSKIKMAAEKQATVLKRKIDQQAAKDKARRDLENKRRCAEKMRLASAMSDNGDVKESRKSELANWVDGELEFCVIDSQIEETKRSLESALANRKELRNNSTDADANDDLVQIESIIRSLKQTVHQLESTAKKAFPTAEGLKSSSSFSFLDTDTFRSLSKNDAKYVLSYIFDTCSSAKKELSAIESTQETSTKAAVDAAIAKEKQLYDKEVMKLKMQHAEVMLSHLETTQGAVTSSIALKMGPDFKSQVDDVLGSYVQSCSTAGNVLKTDLHQMKESQEGMQKMIEGIAFASKKPKAKKKTAMKSSSYESEEEEIITDESFQEDIGEEDSDYEPTPAKSKRRGGTKKAAAAPPTPLFGEEFIIDEQFINDDLQSMRVQSLKKVCKHLGVTATGKKADILDRIRASYQSNAALSSPSSDGASSQHEENQQETFGSIRKKVNFELDADIKQTSKLEKENYENPKTPSSAAKKRPPRDHSIVRSPIRPGLGLGLSPVRHSSSSGSNATPLHLRQTASSKRRRMSSMPIDQRPSAITASAKKRQRQKMNESIAKLGLGLGDDMSEKPM
ncbi:kinesin family protein [Skeletonema marinoi]|uniref:Kinesin family protein n=1 Tax=Skeletonema marinoi TaxID=267567 RepID=A0AAD8XTS5_9STRA|nr:kinesin family protein [Skeletonema marinoi]